MDRANWFIYKLNRDFCAFFRGPYFVIFDPSVWWLSWLHTSTQMNIYFRYLWVKGYHSLRLLINYSLCTAFDWMHLSIYFHKGFPNLNNVSMRLYYRNSIYLFHKILFMIHLKSFYFRNLWTWYQGYEDFFGLTKISLRKIVSPRINPVRCIFNLWVCQWPNIDAMVEQITIGDLLVNVFFWILIVLFHPVASLIKSICLKFVLQCKENFLRIRTQH